MFVSSVQRYKFLNVIVVIAESPFAEMGPLIPVPVKVKKSKHKKQKSKKKKEKYRLHSGHLEVVWKKQVSGQ